jgi:hypothetical protein
MSFFGKSKILLKKTIHFIHFVRPPNLCGVTFMVRMRTHRDVTMRPLCSHLEDRGNFAQNGVIMGNLFLYNIGMAIFRDVLYFIIHRIAFYPLFLTDIYFNTTTIPNSGHFSGKVCHRKIRFMSQKWGSLFSAFSHFVYTPF